MKKFLYFALALAAVAVSAGPSLRNHPVDGDLWKRIDSLEGQGLYRSALSLADRIYRAARLDSDAGLEIKALIYRLKYIQELEEEGQLAAISELEGLLPDDRPVQGALKHSILAELLFRYYNSVRWEIMQNAPVAGRVPPEKSEWPPELFYSKIREHFKASTASADLLAGIPTSSLSLLWTGNPADTANRPTLYDILMSRSAEFGMRAEEFRLAEPRPALLASPELFADPDAYRSAVEASNRLDRGHYLDFLGHFSDWESNTSERARPAVDLMRLNLARDLSVHPGKDSLFRAALVRWAERLKNDSLACLFQEALAGFHLERAGMFRINEPDTAAYALERLEAKGWLGRAETWSATLAGKRCQNLAATLAKPELNALAEDCGLPGRPFPVSLEYRNTARIFFRISKYPALDYHLEWNRREPPQKIGLLDSLPAVDSGSLDLPDDGLMNPHRVNLVMKPLPAGFYLLTFSTDSILRNPGNLVVTIPLQFSGITLVTRQLTNTERAFYIRNRETGEAIRGAVASPWFLQSDPRGGHQILVRGDRTESGEEGFLKIRDEGRGRGGQPGAYRLMVSFGGEDFLTDEVFYPGYLPGKPEKRTSALVHTDRRLYKPGSTVYFRGVLMDHKGDSVFPGEADSISFLLQDPRYQVVSKITLPVDTMGVFGGEFLLPYRGLTGNYTLQSKYGQATVLMDQYRRPGFDIQIERNGRIYHPGDEMELQGRLMALSGEPVTGAAVRAEIEAVQVWGPRRWQPHGTPGLRIGEAELVSDSGGRFLIRWKSLNTVQLPFSPDGGAGYKVKITATDLNGETRLEEARIDCGGGTVSLRLGIDNEVSVTDTLKITTGISSSDGRNLAAAATLKVTRLAGPDRRWDDPVLPEPDRFIISRTEWQRQLPELPYRREHRKEFWMQGPVMLHQNIAPDSITGSVSVLMTAWKPGWYRAELSSERNLAGKPSVVYFLVRDPGTRKADGYLPLSVSPSPGLADPGAPAGISLASARKGFVLIDPGLSGADGGPLWIRTGPVRKKLAISLPDNGADLVSVRLILIRSNRLVEKTLRIPVRREHVRLELTGFEQIQGGAPGDSLAVRFLVRDDQGNPVQASVAVTVYDASLDRIAAHDWIIPTRSYPGFAVHYEPLNRSVRNSEYCAEPPVAWQEVPYTEPLSLNWFGMGTYGIFRQDAGALRMEMARPQGVSEPAGEMKSLAVRQDADPSGTGQPDASGEAVSAEKPAEAILRKEFRETAFFTGNLITDREGVGEIRVGMPDALTEWKVIAAAHDNRMTFGKATHRFSTSLELMIKPNFPTIAYEGDSILLPARITWSGNGRVSALTSVKVTDSVYKPLTVFPSRLSELEAGQSDAYAWPFIARESGTVYWEIRSESATASDAVADTIRILPGNVSLWKAQPFFLSKPGIRKLKVTGVPSKAVFEVVTNPAWQVLGSLPYVTGNERDCSEYWFSRFYLACITGHVATEYPEVTRRFLADTVPTGQEERYRQIRAWSDPDSLKAEISYLTGKLSDLQSPDGTWPWFRGMGPDYFMTQQLVAGFGELRALGILDPFASRRGSYMVTQAVGALDNWLYGRYRDLIRRDSVQPVKMQLDPMIIHYLYARSFFPELTFAPANEIAWLHYLERIRAEWALNEPGLQALLGIASIRLGRAREADPIYASLKERSAYDDQWGRHWPRKGQGSGWFNWDLWFQSRMIEFFAGLEQGRNDLDDMRLWLVHQKRGRDWGNGMVAAWACKSLLFYRGREPFTPGSVEMRWGREHFSPLRIVTGSSGVAGFYRYEWKQGTLPESPDVEVRHTEGGPAWGTLYTLSDHKSDELSAEGGPLRVERTLFIRDEAGRWKELQDTGKLHAGQVCLVRINVISDREMSYVEVTDRTGTGAKPLKALSGYRYFKGVGYYLSAGPGTLTFYVPELRKGNTVLEYEAAMELEGNLFGGYATATCLYAPEFRGWSSSRRILSGN